MCWRLLKRRRLLMWRLKRRRLLWWRLLRRRLLLLLLLVWRRRRDRRFGAARDRAGTQGSAVLIEAHAGRRRAEVVKAAAAAASSAPVEAATAAAATPEPISRHVRDQGAVETEAEKSLRECGGHLASHKMADDTGCVPPLSSSYIGQLGPTASPGPGARLTRIQGPTASPGPGARRTRIQGPAAPPGPGARPTRIQGPAAPPGPGARPTRIQGPAAPPGPGARPTRIQGPAAPPGPGARPTRIQGPAASPGPGTQAHPDPGAHGLTRTRGQAHPDPGAHGLTRTRGQAHPDPGPKLTRSQGPTASPGPGARLTRIQGPAASPGPGAQAHPDPGARAIAYGSAHSHKMAAPSALSPKLLRAGPRHRQASDGGFPVAQGCLEVQASLRCWLPSHPGPAQGTTKRLNNQAAWGDQAGGAGGGTQGGRVADWASRTLSSRRQWRRELSVCAMAAPEAFGRPGAPADSRPGPPRSKAKAGDLAGCLLRHKAFRKPPQRRGFRKAWAPADSQPAGAPVRDSLLLTACLLAPYSLAFCSLAVGSLLLSSLFLSPAMEGERCSARIPELGLQLVSAAAVAGASPASLAALSRQSDIPQGLLDCERAQAGPRDPPPSEKFDATSALALTISPLGLSPKKVGDGIAKATSDQKGLKHKVLKELPRDRKKQENVKH
ncbi:hypothetical protein QTO34_018790, partial [Cnephaeus nilssonii]